MSPFIHSTSSWRCLRAGFASYPHTVTPHDLLLYSTATVRKRLACPPCALKARA